jgi:superkiller protein 8
VKPVRAVAFTPLAKMLAAAGDSRVIALYDVRSGEQIALLSGHTAWITALHFSDTGEWLLSGLVILTTAGIC